MIYLDSSVVLAHLFAEDRTPPSSIWDQGPVSSRLLEYEVWIRVRARPSSQVLIAAAEDAIDAIRFVELARPVLERAKQAFPVPVRTLDALHLSTALFLRSHRSDVSLATYDVRMREAGRALEIPLADL